MPKVLLRHVNTNLFVQDATRWVADQKEALQFGTMMEATAFRHAHNIQATEYYFSSATDLRGREKASA